MGARLSWQTHHPLIIRLLESRGTPDPQDTAEQVILLECGLGQVEGNFEVKKGPVASSLSPPLLHSFLQECLLADLRQQLWILRHVLFGRCDYFHRKNIFIVKTLSVVRGCFARFFVWFASPWRELCLPLDL